MGGEAREGRKERKGGRKGREGREEICLPEAMLIELALRMLYCAKGAQWSRGYARIWSAIGSEAKWPNLTK